VGFKIVILCEKPNQAKVFKEALGLTQIKKVDGVNAAYYDREGGTCVVHLSGHLLELKPPDFYAPSLHREKQGWNKECLPVIPPGNRWPLVPKYDSRPNERRRINGLLGGIKWAMVGAGAPSEIALAVDNDKEGELLGWETLEYLGVAKHPNISRVLYSEINAKAMKKALDVREPGSKWFPRYLAGLARQYADWLVGMNITIGMTVENKDLMPRYNPLNSGRVVFAISYLLYKRSELIKAYKPQNYYTESITLKTKEGKYIGRVLYPKNYLDPEINQLTRKELADKISAHLQAQKEGTVTRYEKEKKKTPPPDGFHRTGFDRHMIRKYGMSLEDISSALQKLYDEKGLITYPRVDVRKLDENMHVEMPQYIDAMAKNMSTSTQLKEQQQTLYKKAFEMADAAKKSKMFAKGIQSGEAHHAIIPTTQTADLSQLNQNEFLVYRELVDRLLVQFLPDYEYASTIIETQVGKFTCKTTGATPLRKGWKGLSQNMEEEADNDEEDGSVLPPLAVGQIVGVLGSETKTNVTKEPHHYTEDELLGDLENPRKFVENKELLKKIKKLQIGTDGTRQAHLTGLIPKGFVVKQSRAGSKKIKELVPTQKLLSLIQIAPTYFKLPETSAYWEDAFNDIQAGNMSLDEFLAKQKRLIQRFVEDLNSGKFRMKEPTVSNYKICPDDTCKGYMFFSEMKKKKFNLWGCAKCSSSYFDEDGKPGKKLGAKGESTGPRTAPDWIPPKDTPKRKCTACTKDFVYYKKIEGKSWAVWECIGCKAAFFDDKGEPGNQLKKKKRD
jgi:DNA topoisomerase-3